MPTCTLNEEMVLSSEMPLVSGDVIDCWVVPRHADEEASIGTVTPSDTGYESPLVEESSDIGVGGPPSLTLYNSDLYPISTRLAHPWNIGSLPGSVVLYIG